MKNIDNIYLKMDPEVEKRLYTIMNNRVYQNTLEWLHQSMDALIRPIEEIGFLALSENESLRRFIEANRLLGTGSARRGNPVYYVIRKEPINELIERQVRGEIELLSQLELLDHDVMLKVIDSPKRYGLVIRELIYVPNAPDSTPQKVIPIHYEYHTLEEPRYVSNTRPFLMTQQFIRDNSTGTYHYQQVHLRQNISFQGYEEIHNALSLAQRKEMIQLLQNGMRMFYMDHWIETEEDLIQSYRLPFP